MSEPVQCYMVVPVFTGERWSEHEGADTWPEWPSQEHPANSSIGHWLRPDTGETQQWPHQFAPGAMWYAIWMPRNWDWDNETQPHLIVKTPSGGDWDIDSRASNCAKPDDKLHRCWVRHGTPPNVTVDKNGLTCPAGGGSIISRGWHGFLRQGRLVT